MPKHLQVHQQKTIHKRCQYHNLGLGFTEIDRNIATDEDK